MRTPLRDKALNFIYKTAFTEYVFGEEDSAMYLGIRPRFGARFEAFRANGKPDEALI